MIDSRTDSASSRAGSGLRKKSYEEFSIRGAVLYIERHNGFRVDNRNFFKKKKKKKNSINSI
jgi:hypothetical protein